MNSLFYDQKLPEGKAIEALVIEHFEDQGISVDDVSQTKKEYDLFVNELPFGFCIEVKGDNIMWNSKRIFAESRTNIEHNQLEEGWLWYTQADELFYVDAVCKVIHVVDPQELRQVVREKHYEVGYCDDRTRGVNRIREGFYIPVTELKQLDSYRAIQL